MELTHMVTYTFRDRAGNTGTGASDMHLPNGLDGAATRKEIETKIAEHTGFVSVHLTNVIRYGSL